MIVVSDTSPILSLALIGRLDLLRDLDDRRDHGERFRRTPTPSSRAHLNASFLG